MALKSEYLLIKEDIFQDSLGYLKKETKKKKTEKSRKKTKYILISLEKEDEDSVNELV